MNDEQTQQVVDVVVSAMEALSPAELKEVVMEPYLSFREGKK